MPGDLRELRAYLRECVVTIGDGTGFFVAPGLVLTCAHVVEPDQRSIPVVWGGRSHPGTVLHRTPDDPSATEHPLPDLAVIELAEPPDHPCVPLSDHGAELGDELLIQGNSRSPGGDGLVPFEVFAVYQGDTVVDGWPILRIANDKIMPGMSGSPVVSARTGTVCGLVKQNAKDGGLAVGLRVLRSLPADLYRRLWRSQDHPHASGVRPEWRDLADRSDQAGPIAPAEERELRRILDELPRTAGLDDLYRVAAGPLAREPDFPLTHHWDIVSDLADFVPGSTDDLPPAVGYAAALSQAAGGETRGKLREWTLMVADRLGQAVRAQRALDGPATVTATAATASLLVRLQSPTPAPGRYRLTIWRITADGRARPVHHDDDAVPSVEARSALQEQLGRHLGGGEESDAGVLVEIAVPRSLLEEDYENLTPWPAQRWSRLGRRHPVVLRDVGRLDRPGTGGRWRERWAALGTRDIGAALSGVECRDPIDHEAVEGWLEESVARAALSPGCSPDGSTKTVLLDVGLPTGVPVMLWRRGRCDHEKCPGESALLAALKKAAAGTDLRGLPDLVRRLRSGAAADATTAEHCGRDLIILYDDPDRLPPRPPLNTPEDAVRHG